VRVSILSALYNHERYVAQAIQSVLAQTHTDWELLIWDDGSTDSSLAIARTYARENPEKIKVFTHPGGANRGQEATRNAALEQATGELIALLDSDDFYLPRKLERLVPLFADPAIGLAYGKAEFLRELEGKRYPSGIELQPEGEVFEALVRDNFICAGATLFRRRCLENGSRFDTSFKTIGEYPLWLRIAKDWKVGHVSEVVSVWRDHGRNLGTTLATEAKAELVRLNERLASDVEYAAFRSAILCAMAKRRYDYACALYDALELQGAERECLAVLRDPAGSAALKAKAGLLLSALKLGDGPNRWLSRAKRFVWEKRYELKTRSRAPRRL
jgi:glycosyltransferase involved in cell wall biosynthesis